MNDPGLPRKIFEMWRRSEPPPEFAERVLHALGAATAAPVRRRVWPKALAATAAVVVLIGLGAPLFPASGEHRAATRQTVRVGAHVAVLEPGAELAWSKGLRAVRVRQRRGSVFYRVERGGAFVVETPAGRVTVAGTCFRVEVKPVHDRKQIAAGAAMGAVLAATVTVLVYEGTVAVANRGNEVSLATGEAAEVDEAGEVRRTEVHRRPEENPEREAASGGANPALAASRVAALEAELARLRRSLSEEEERRRAEDGWRPRSRDDRLAIAKRCEVRYDLPPSAWNLGHTVDERRAAELGLAEDERRRVNEALHEEGIRLVEALRTLYVDLTGNVAGVATLEPFTLQQEILSKANAGDLALARQRVAREQAGLVPPGDATTGTPVERALRLLVRAGDDWERRLASILGAGRAAELRSPNRLFARWRTQGCPGEEGSAGSD